MNSVLVLLNVVIFLKRKDISKVRGRWGLSATLYQQCRLILAVINLLTWNAVYFKGYLWSCWNIATRISILFHYFTFIFNLGTLIILPWSFAFVNTESSITYALKMLSPRDLGRLLLCVIYHVGNKKGKNGSF